MITVSIITVAYNAEFQIEKTIQSVINQISNYKIEYIIIDGDSKDNTLNIINKYKNHINYLLSEKDEGIYDAMNKAIIKCRGHYLYFLNAGDILLPGVFNSLKDPINSNYDIIYGHVKVGNNNDIWGCKNIETIFYDMPFSHQAVLVKRHIMTKYNFNTKYKIAADYNLFLNLYLENYIFYKTDTIFSLYDTNGISNSSSIVTIIEYFKVLNTSAKMFDKLIWPIAYLYKKRSFLIYLMLEKFNLLNFGRKFKRLF